MKLTKGLLVCALLSLVAFPLGSEAQHFYRPRQPNSPSANTKASNPLLYFGGPVISNVKVIVVLWGPNVNPTIATKIGTFYAELADSTYVTWLGPIYNTFRSSVTGQPGTNQNIGAGKYMGTFTISPAVTQGTIDDVNIQAELQLQVDIGVLPQPDKNTLYMVYFPPNLTITSFGATSCVDYCAYHFFNGLPDPTITHITYGVMPDISAPACFAGCSSTPPNPPTLFSTVTSISSHEFEESITDPFPTPGVNPSYPQAWNTIDGFEIGDLCAFVSPNNPLITPQGLFWVQSEWSNAGSRCTTRVWVGH